MDAIDRYRGSIVGLAVGDALGHPTEFVSSVAAIHARWGGPVVDFQRAGSHPAGTFTDDTQMTIAVARGLIRSGHADLDAMMKTLGEEFVAWARSPENNRAPGGTCLRGCSALKNGVAWRLAGVADSKGCGAAMRAAPVGLYFADDIDMMIRVAAAQSALTHRHPTGIASGVAAAAAVAHVLRTGSLEGILDFTRDCVAKLDRDLLLELGCHPPLADAIGNREMLAALDDTRAALEKETDDVCSLLGGAWVGESAVATALWCVLKANGDFQESIVRGANSSGDSDSIATIAGSITGALHGLAGIAERYRTGVEKSGLLEEIASELHRAKHGADLERTPGALDIFGAQRQLPRPPEATTEAGAAVSEIEDLEAQIKHHNKLYWDDAKPEISDTDYDKLVRRLKALAPDSPVLDAMGPSKPAELGSSFTHAEAMLSLDKCYEPQELADWATTFEGSSVAMPKFDGIACSLHFDDKGRLVRAVTRGDGKVGDDITANAIHIKDIPKKTKAKKALEVRGEIYMSLSVFARYKAEGMANPRNLTAGAIKQKDAKKSAAYTLSFAGYDLIGSDLPTQVDALAYLEEMGFPKVDHYVLDRADVFRGYEEFAKQRPSLDYEIDGVVFKANSVKEQRRLGHTSHHPRYAIAYKFQGDSGTTKLVDIEWSVARTGAITPVAIVEPVALSGVTVTRASLHHAGFLQKLDLTIGAEVEIVRRGGVIPNVERVVKAGGAKYEIPTECPSCKRGAEMRKDFLFCKDPSTCRDAIIGQLGHYAGTTDMMGFGGSILAGAYDAGMLSSPADFYKLTWEQLSKLDRCGEKVAKKLIKEVDKKRKLELGTFLRALGIHELGKKISELLANQYGTLDAVLALEEAELAAAHGVGGVIAKSVTEGLKEMRPLIDALAKEVELAAPAKGGSTGPLAGKSFVFTGKMVAFARSEGEKRVRALGGAVLGSVAKGLDYLVVGADKTGGPSTKQKAADKLIAAGASLAILSEDEYLAMVDGSAAPAAAKDAPPDAAADEKPGDAEKTSGNDKGQMKLF
jgi:DNA ligase (NAD+)